MIVDLYAKSDVGRVRRGNEDNFLVLDLTTEQTWTGSDGAVPPEKLKRFDLGDRGLVLVVSDGMGGALAGDVASRMAVDSVREVLLGTSTEGEACDPNLDLVECLKNATIYANLAIHAKGCVMGIGSLQSRIDRNLHAWINAPGEFPRHRLGEPPVLCGPRRKRSRRRKHECADTVASIDHVRNPRD